MILTEEVIGNLVVGIILAFVGGVITLGTGAIGVMIVVWSDVRSLKKGQNAGFSKIRNIERKVFGQETSIGDK